MLRRHLPQSVPAELHSATCSSVRAPLYTADSISPRVTRWQMQMNTPRKDQSTAEAETVRYCPAGMARLPTLPTLSTLLVLLTLLCVVGPAPAVRARADVGDPRILVFSQTAAFRHDSIPAAIGAVTQLGAPNGFTVDATEDPRVFADDRLAAYRAVVFLSTTGNILDDGQRAAFQRYIEAGHGFVGVHSAADTGYDWPWYAGLVGTYFASHPDIQPATLHVEDTTHPSTADLPATWNRTDEWYDFRSNPREVPGMHVLLTLDESSYSGGSMGADHPWSWYHAYDGGRAWYTAGGHTLESYSEGAFLRHLLGGIQYAAALTSQSATGSWTSAAPMPTERAEVGAAVVDGKIYVVGAYSGATDANDAYDPGTDSWQTLAPLPRPLNHVCAAGVDHVLYVVGGYDPTNANRPVDSTFAYDPATNTWTARAPLPTPRGALACATVGQTIYAVGGTSPAGDTGAIEAYTPSTDTWQPDLAPMPTPRDHLAVAAFNGQVHAIGGRSPSLGLTGATHEVYDPSSNAWSAAAPLPTGRSGIGAAVLGDRIHVLGGEADHTFPENEAYDPSTGTWQSFAALPMPRHGIGVVSFGNAIYVLAGGRTPGDSRSNVVEIFSLF
jgi:type 1 glutamine amidotransferase